MKKNLLKYAGFAFLLLTTAVACSPDDFDGGSEAGQPSIADINVSVTVDQETNYVTFAVNNPGCYPVWTINITPTLKTTDNGFKRFVPQAGTYDYSVKLANRNGISQGEYTGSFVVNTTRFDFSEYQAALATAEGKKWRIYAARDQHMGCGPLYSEGNEWWKAQAWEKINETIYDDTITFTTDGKYIYDPGPNGYVFCNNAFKQLGVDISSGDYNAPATLQETTYGFTVINGEPAIALAPRSFFPYMMSDAFYNQPLFRIWNTDEFKKDGKVLVLVADDPANNISWKYILVNGEDEAQEEEFDVSTIEWVSPTSDENLLKILNTDDNKPTMYYADPSWTPYNPTPTVSFSNGKYSWNYPNGTYNQWQAQFTFSNMDITLNEGEVFDLSVKVKSSTDIGKATIKINQNLADASSDENNNNFLIEANFALVAGEETYVRFGKLAAAKDIPHIQLLFDFAPCEAGTDMEVSEIILQKHADATEEEGYIY